MPNLSSNADLSEVEDDNEYVHKLNEEVDPYYTELDVEEFLSQLLPGTHSLTADQLERIGGFQHVPDLNELGNVTAMYPPIVSKSSVFNIIARKLMMWSYSVQSLRICSPLLGCQNNIP